MSQHIANHYFQHPIKNEPSRRIKTLYSMNDSNSCRNRKVIIPKNISIDKETLYEQLHLEKLKTKQLQIENQSLQNILQQFGKEVDMMDENDQRKVIQQSLIRIKQKDQEISMLKENTQFKAQQDLKKQIQDLKKELLKYQILQKFEGEQNQIVQDNINLLNKIESQKQYISELEKIRVDYIQVKAKHNQLLQVMKFKDQQIQRYRDRDPLSEMNMMKHHSKNENLLVDELQLKMDEIQHLQTRLNQYQQIIQENQNALTELSYDSQQKIQLLEAEKKQINDKYDKLQIDYNILLEKQKQIDKYLQQFAKKKLQTQTLIYGEDQLFQSATQVLLTPLISPHHGDNIVVKQVKKQQIEQTILELKLSLRKKRITLQDAEIILLSAEDEITINDLEKQLRLDPFNLKNSTLLARYLIEDYTDKDFVYDPDLKAPKAKVKSVFRNLMQNYKLNFDQNIKDLVETSIKRNLIDFCVKQSLSTLNLENINECMVSQDIPWNSKHSDYLQQMYYNKYNKYLNFELNNLLKLFDITK
ncbi:unnamed protein product [Paramecium pentaurelia]|uniref:Uncharacterized protein n=1 Tax=Paramecium pentaurelia TaxID=43138 RepID=A0A8S1SLM9_9CILI|nr:unnamed protein product [Paramecium pentaurelia]